MTENNKNILVVGGGISGVSVALEAAETGYDVILVEKNPTLGGMVAGFHQYFPKLCPPTCGLEINYRRLRANPRVRVLTSTEVQSLEGQAGSYQVSLKKAPAYVDERCVICDKCTAACPVEIPSGRNYGMSSTKAIHLPGKMAYPPRYVIHREACPPDCKECLNACTYNAIDLNAQAGEETVQVSSVVFATGWKPYDATRLELYSINKQQDVITNVMMERLAAADGPTQGKLLRPSDGSEVQSVAFVQCAGSRDENHLPYCSAVCCLASLKQARYVREANPQAQVHIFYIDIRTPGKYETFYSATRADENIHFIKGKVAGLQNTPEGKVRVEAEDILGGSKITRDVDLVVLATGMQPNGVEPSLAAGLVGLDENGFIAANLQKPGIYSAGVAKNPLDVNSSIQDSTGTALKAIQTVVQTTAESR
ncbi:MAG: CoB--CoM heterodisulfide reductase iron-sulfur subunit A family protein [Deltaproteobacteria bacterium]|nr:CoB--CoM heterodisulfide reductase iron-sulfur subunit A family protein [Deltaproteobacteria bacterium]